MSSRLLRARSRSRPFFVPKSFTSNISAGSIDANDDDTDIDGQRPAYSSAHGGSKHTTQQPVEARFFSAAKKGDERTLRSLLATGNGAALINRKGENGRTPLLAAARFGNSRCVQLLLSHGADPEIRNDAGVTPLMVAASHGHFECVRTLLILGASLETRDATGMTAMEWAAQAKQKRVLTYMKSYAITGDLFPAAPGSSAASATQSANDIGTVTPPASAIALTRAAAAAAATTASTATEVGGGSRRRLPARRRSRLSDFGEVTAVAVM